MEGKNDSHDQEVKQIALIVFISICIALIITIMVLGLFLPETGIQPGDIFLLDT